MSGSDTVSCPAHDVPSPMLSFAAGTHRFHVRAAAIVLRDDAVLLHRAEGDRFWALPGGRVEAGESAAEAVARELREELDAAVRPLRLVWVIENFFSHGGEAHHEIGLYFLAEALRGSRLLDAPAPTRDAKGHGD